MQYIHQYLGIIIISEDKKTGAEKISAPADSKYHFENK